MDENSPFRTPVSVRRLQMVFLVSIALVLGLVLAYSLINAAAYQQKLSIVTLEPN
jgi:hypothetical protein